MSSLVKIAFILLAAVGAWHIFTPPQSPAGAGERIKVDGLERSFGSVVRIHAQVLKVRLASRSFLRGQVAPIPASATHPYAYVVFRPREPPRRARRLSVLRVVFIAVVVLLFLPLYDNVASIAAAATTGSGTTCRVCGRMPGDGRSWPAAPCMLQDSRLALHVRARPTEAPSASDERSICICAPPGLQRRFVRNRGHFARTLWPGLLVGTGGVVGHTSRADLRLVLVRDGGVRGCEYCIAWPEGGCALKEGVWIPVGCVGG
jgi:hypothetical protein